MPIQIPDYYAQADERQARQQQLAQQMMVTQGMQFDIAAKQKAASQAEKFSQLMSAQPDTESPVEAISQVIGAARASGDWTQAGKITETIGKGLEHSAKAQEQQWKAADEKIKAQRDQSGEIGSLLSGVQSQGQLNDANEAYKLSHNGQGLPPSLRVYRPGMADAFVQSSMTPLDQQKMLIEKQKADAVTMADKAKAALQTQQIQTEKAKAAQEIAMADRARKEGGLYAAETENVKAGKGIGGDKAPGGTGQNDRNNYTQNVVSAGIQLQTDLKNLLEAPEGTSLSWLAGMSSKSGPALTDALRSKFARDATPTENQAYQAMSAGMSTAVTIFQTNGRGPGTESQRAANETALSIKDTDKPYVKAYKLARGRQEIDITNDAIQVNPKATKDQKAKFQEIADEIHKIVPFTTSEVVKAMPTNGRTMIQSVETNLHKAKQAVTPPSKSDFMDKARAANPGTSDEDLSKYYDEHYAGNN